MYEAQIDSIQEWTDEAISAYEDYISVVKESLSAERDLYEFRKDIQKQTKDISQLERRISSLSGADDASSVAERRKLEAELLEAKENLSDTYYSHAKDAQSEALDREAEAYEESMTNYIDTLREKLDQAKLNMDLFMEQVTTAVTMNAGTVLTEYTNTGIAIDTALTEPWANASTAMKGYETEALPLMNSWTKSGENGFVYNFSTNATSQLQSPWNAGKTAISSFQSAVKTGMEDVVTKVTSNVNTASGKLSALYKQIQDTAKKAAEVSGGGGDYTYTPPPGDKVTKIGTAQGVTGRKSGGTTKTVNGVSYTQVDGVWYKTSDTWYDKTTKTYNVFKGSSAYSINDSKASSQFAKHNSLIGPRKGQVEKTSDAVIAQDNITGLYYVSWSGTGTGASRSYWIKADTKQNAEKIRDALKSKAGWTPSQNYNGYLKKYAKGTLGTTRDEFAITDESWIGEEITLAAGKNGQLQYLKKGSAVMPADISANLVEWGKLNPDMMSIGGAPNLNMISNCVSKPEFNISFDSLVKAENITEETLPAVKKLVTQELNRFTKELNYAIKGKGGR